MPESNGKSSLITRAAALDEKHSVASQVRARFPRGEVVAAAAHSLSRPCKEAFEAVKGAFDRTNELLHGIHWGQNEKESSQHDYAFKLHLHVPACQTLSELLGCKRDDVNLGNGLSDDMIRLLETLVHPDIFGERCKMMCLKFDFNSDLTIVRSFLLKNIVAALTSAASLHRNGGLTEKGSSTYSTLAKIFLDPSVAEQEQFDYIEKHFLVVVEPEANRLYSEDHMLELIDKHKTSLAGALLPAVVFNTSQLLDIGRVNPKFVANGIPAIWDLAHSIGNVQHTLEKDQVLAGAGCGYKHLSGLAGCPGVIFQNSALLADMAQKWPHMVPTPVSGWLSHGRTGAFDTFGVIDRFCASIMHRRESVQRMRAGNPDILSLRVLIANLKVISDFGVQQIMMLKGELSKWLFECLDEAFKEEIKSGALVYITPHAEDKRGASICFSLANVSASKVEHALSHDEFSFGHKFEIDTRPGGDGPDTIRLTAHYAHMSFADTAALALCLKHVYDKLREDGEPASKRLRLEPQPKL